MKAKFSRESREDSDKLNSMLTVRQSGSSYAPSPTFAPSQSANAATPALELQ